MHFGGNASPAPTPRAPLRRPLEVAGQEKRMARGSSGRARIDGSRAVLLASSFLLLAPGCTPGIVTFGEPEICSPDAPNGACTDGEVCVEGTCAIDCSVACGGA